MKTPAAGFEVIDLGARFRAGELRVGRVLAVLALLIVLGLHSGGTRTHAAGTRAHTPRRRRLLRAGAADAGHDELGDSDEEQHTKDDGVQAVQQRLHWLEEGMLTV